MNVIDILIQPQPEQLHAIFNERQRINEETSKACLKARQAAVYLHRESWSLHCLTYVNALLIGVRKVQLQDPYITMVLLSTIESFSFGQIGMRGLTYQEYNLAIGPVASILAPEMFQTEQNWDIEVIPVIKYRTPYYPENYVSIKGRKKPDLDPYGELEEAGIDARALERMIQTMSVDTPAVTNTAPTDGLSAMERMKLKMRGLPALPTAEEILIETAVILPDNWPVEPWELPDDPIERMKQKMRERNGPSS